MPPTAPDEATRLLNRLSAGDTSVSTELYELVYDKLKNLARHHMAHQSPEHTLQPTALVHETYLRIVGRQGSAWENRKAFYGLASRVMRSVLVDHARERGAKKRGGDRVRIPLEEETPATGERNEIDVLDLNGALDELSAIDEDLVRLLELRFFGGLSVKETAAALDVPQRTVERRLRVAGAWLRDRLDGT